MSQGSSTIVTLPKTTADIGETLSNAVRQEKYERRQVLLRIISNIRFLARQGLPLRGDGDESDSNFMQLFLLRGEDNPTIVEWLKRRSDRYTSPEIQNSIIKVMGVHVLREIAREFQNTTFYTVMADETTDCSNNEQVVVCLRYVDDAFEIEEKFIGLYSVDATDSLTLSLVIKDVLTRLNLTLSKVRGQCYDGASCMSGTKSGVAARLLNEEPRAIYTHCYGHALRLACSDSIKQCKLMKDALDTTHEISKLIRKPPRREGIFQKLKQDLTPDSPGVRVLCPTRWTVRAESLKSILDNYKALQATWTTAIEVVKDTEMKCRIIGVMSQMKTFNFVYGVMLGHLVLVHSDNLSRTLQKKDMSAAEGQIVADLTISTLARIRSDENFELFWQKVLTTCADFEVEEPHLPRQRKVPRRYEVGNADPEFPLSVVDEYTIKHSISLPALSRVGLNNLATKLIATYKIYY